MDVNLFPICTCGAIYLYSSKYSLEDLPPCSCFNYSCSCSLARYFFVIFIIDEVDAVKSMPGGSVQLRHLFAIGDCELGRHFDECAGISWHFILTFIPPSSTSLSNPLSILPPNRIISHPFVSYSICIYYSLLHIFVRPLFNWINCPLAPSRRPIGSVPELTTTAASLHARS